MPAVIEPPSGCSLQPRVLADLSDGPPNRSVGRVAAAGLVVGLTFGVALGVAAASADPEVVELPGEGGGTCSLRSSDPVRPGQGRLRPLGEGRLLWAAREGDEVRCSGAFEPLDLAVGEGGGAGSVELRPLPARAVTVVSDGPSLPTVVEWRAPGRQPGLYELRDDAPSALLARREAAWEGRRLALPVASQPRWLRFQRPDSSPWTVAVDPDSEAPEIRLPPPAPGGEIFGTVGSARIRPEALLVERVGRLEVASDGTFGRHGLAPGRFALVPMYRGGVRGPAFPVTVADGGTAELLLIPLPEVAGVSFVLPPEVCPPSDPSEAGLETLTIDRLEPGEDRRTREVVRRHELALEDGTCAGELEGLEPGRYSVAALDGESDAVASVEVTLPAGEVVEARLAAAVVRVTGRVTVGEDEPFVDALVEFAKPGVRKRTETDALGRYELSLPEPGDYRVVLRATRFMPLRGFDRRLDAGEQEVDLHVEGGVIDLGIRTLDGSEIEEPIQVQVERHEGAGTTGFLLPEEGPSHVFPGLAYGDYRVLAFSPSGWNSEEPAEVTLSEDEPYARVELLLRRSAYRLRLVDPAGQPIAGAFVKVGMVLPKEQAPGMFELTGAAPGHRLEVRARGFSPVCRTLSGAEGLTLTLRPARGEALIVFPEGTVPHGSVIGLPGSDCPVRDDLLDGTLTRAEEGSALTLRGLPQGEFVFTQAGEGSVRFSVPGPPVVFGQAGGDT